MPLGVPPGPPAPLSFSVSVLNFARAPPPAPPGAVARGERATARAAPAATGRAVSLSVLVPNEHHKWKVSFFFPASFIGCAGAHRSSAVQTASGPRLPLPQFYGCGTWEVGRRGAGLGLAEAHTASSFDELEED